MRQRAFEDALFGALKQCPCCDYLTLPTRGWYELCRICFWEDNGLALDRLGAVSGPNHQTLREARASFAALGACSEDARGSVLGEQARAAFVRQPR